MPKSSIALGPQGPFVQNLSWFSIRECQIQMAEMIEQLLDSGQHALLESGTGTGKTFAYLVPPLLHNKKVLISTRTKHLQEQLFQKDIPVVCEVLGLQPVIRMLKGRANYLCLLRHDRAKKNPDLLGIDRKIFNVYDWVMDRGDGDISEYGMPQEELQMMTATTQTCVGSECDFWKECFANRARQDAKDADILVVNHNLLSLGVAHHDLKDESSITHGFDVVIVDEAHRFPEIACNSLGITFSQERIDEFCRNLESVAPTVDLDINVVASATKQLTESADYLSREIAAESFEVPLDIFENNKQLADAYWNIVKILDNTIGHLESHVEVSRDVEMCRNLAANIADDARTIFEREKFEVAYWCESGKSGFAVNQLPLEPGKVFGPAIMEFDGSWVFTSATIAVGDDFSYFEQSMGLDDTVRRRWESPFDFKKQTLAYFPPNMPLPVNPTREEYNQRVIEVIEKVVPLTQGRTLALFTSIASMKAAKEYLAEHINFTLLCQYDQSNSQLLEDFMRDGNAVLLGTSGFWEGVDIKGDALSCVIIDKLPFVPFDTPKEKTRRSLMEAQGKSFFNDWQVPSAVLALKQGIGRLIRDASDRGVLVLCDPRIHQKAYGQKFLDSLPPMPQSNSIDRISEFFSV